MSPVSVDDPCRQYGLRSRRSDIREYVKKCKSVARLAVILVATPEIPSQASRRCAANWDWDSGLVSMTGYPKKISGLADLATRGCKTLGTLPLATHALPVKELPLQFRA